MGAKSSPSLLRTGAVVTLSSHPCVLPALTGGIRQRAETATTPSPALAPSRVLGKLPSPVCFCQSVLTGSMEKKRQNVQGRNGEAFAPGREAGSFLGRGGFPGVGQA